MEKIIFIQLIHIYKTDYFTLKNCPVTRQSFCQIGNITGYNSIYKNLYKETIFLQYCQIIQILLIFINI
jgi:hypothetical protein